MDGKRERVSFFRLFQLIVLLAWIVAFWVLLQHIGGSPLLGRFLRPNYWWLVEIGTVILVFFVISLVYCDPHNRGRRGLGLVLQMGILVLPLLYLPTAAVSELGPEAARKRSFYMVRPGPLMEANLAAGRKSKLPEDASLLRLALEAEPYEGKKVATIGMVYWDDRLPQGSFCCYQLLMFCCAADARPIGIVVEYDKSRSLEKGCWVKVEGTLGFATFAGQRLTKVRADKVTATEPARDPYLLP